MKKLLLLVAILPVCVWAQAVPLRLGYQGRLMANDGTPLTGYRSVVFSIYKGSTGATDTSPVWSETQTLAFTNGFYATFLGAHSSLAPWLFDEGGAYVGVTVDGEELKPRQQIGSVVYAFQAAYAAEAGHAASATNLTGGSVATTQLEVGRGAATIDALGVARLASISAQGIVNAGGVNSLGNVLVRNGAISVQNAGGEETARVEPAGNARFSNLSVGGTIATAGNVTAPNIVAMQKAIQEVPSATPGLLLGGAGWYRPEICSGKEDICHLGAAQCTGTWGSGTCSAHPTNPNWKNLSCASGTLRPVGDHTILCVR